MIPKIIHIVWVGDESKRPDNCIETWRKLNPGWNVRVWGNSELLGLPWLNKKHMGQMFQRELNGVGDLLRWEILYNIGGFAVDADSICLSPLPDWLTEHEVFACWENELVRPGLIAAGYVGARPNNPFIGQIVVDINAEESVIDRPAWVSVGPRRITDSWQKYRYNGLSILPSHYFIPEHPEAEPYKGEGHKFARQFWASTFNKYDTLHQMVF